MRHLALTIITLLCIIPLLAQEGEIKPAILWHQTIKIGTDFGHNSKHLEGVYKAQESLDINIKTKWLLTDSTLTRKLRWIEGGKLKTERMSYPVEHLTHVTYRDSGEAGIFLDRTYVTQKHAFLVTINHHSGYAQVTDLVDDISYLSREAQIIWYSDTKRREELNSQPTSWRKKKFVNRRRSSGPRR